MMRSFGLDLVQSAQFIGALLLSGGVAGILLGGALGDRLGARDRRWYALLPALCYVAGTPQVERVVFCCFSEEDAGVYQRVLETATAETN